MTKVAHIRQSPPGWIPTDEPTQEHVYIGRPGVFGNPYRLRKDTPQARQRLLRRYKRWLWCRLSRDAQFRRWVRMLSGATLVCYCAPKACHGDVLAKAADWLAAGNEPETFAEPCGLHE